MGYQKDQVLALLLPNIPEYPILVLGAASVGMPVSLINPTFTAGLLN